MESFIVHIYRRENMPGHKDARRKTDQCYMAGVLELVASERRIPFHSAEELWGILTANSSIELHEE